ncbi:MAG: hypothetical protein LBV68_00715 [Spirochaetaceae bacterium]|nr:hypothetical protein [Spirochaetaceae bacterium]
MEDTFTQIHEYLRAFSGKTDLLKNGKIKLGDYVDLAGLKVTGTGSGGEINETTNTPIDGGAHGYLLRIMVVGINSFNPQANGRTNYAGGVTPAIPHIVMQFQNIPGKRMINITATAYEGSAMQTYLTGNFTDGLKLAGVPMSDGTIIWGPTREITNTAQNGTDPITDTLWLPTEWEMFNENFESNGTYEKLANQAYLEYYTDPLTRIKYGKGGGTGAEYWEASPYRVSAAGCCNVDGNGIATFGGLAASIGFAPAFCVK